MDPDPIISAREGRLLIEPALSWSAIFAGALVALATAEFFNLLAAGFGYDLATSLSSPAALAAFTPVAGALAVAAQVIAAALGGYLAGRLRHPWLSAHLDEAHFRDTAQGLIAWALATVAGLGLAATVLIPYAARLAMIAPPTNLDTTDPTRMAHILAQSAFFMAIGMLVSAFAAAVAARIGGLRSEEMHLRARA